MTVKDNKPVPGGTFISKGKAHGMIRERNVSLLEAGHILSVKPGVLLQKVKCGSVYRYQMRGEK